MRKHRVQKIPCFYERLTKIHSAEHGDSVQCSWRTFKSLDTLNDDPREEICRIGRLGGGTIIVLRKLSLEILTKWVLAFFHLQPWHHRTSGRLLLAPDASLSVSPGVCFHCAHCLTQNCVRTGKRKEGFGGGGGDGVLLISVLARD